MRFTDPIVPVILFPQRSRSDWAGASPDTAAVEIESRCAKPKLKSVNKCEANVVFRETDLVMREEESSGRALRKGDALNIVTI